MTDNEVPEGALVLEDEEVLVLFYSADRHYRIEHDGSTHYEVDLGDQYSGFMMTTRCEQEEVPGKLAEGYLGFEEALDHLGAVPPAYRVRDSESVLSDRLVFLFPTSQLPAYLCEPGGEISPVACGSVVSRLAPWMSRFADWMSALTRTDVIRPRRPVGNLDVGVQILQRGSSILQPEFLVSHAVLPRGYDKVTGTWNKDKILLACEKASQAANLPVGQRLAIAARSALVDGEYRRSMVEAGAAVEAALKDAVSGNQSRTKLADLIKAAASSQVIEPRLKLGLDDLRRKRNEAVHDHTEPTLPEVTECLKVMDTLLFKVYGFPEGDSIPASAGERHITTAPYYQEMGTVQDYWKYP